MKQTNGVDRERNRFWARLICGAIMGGGWGAGFGWNLFETRVGTIAISLAFAVIVAICCAKSHYSVWELILGLLDLLP
jgi:hypothetical protein